MKGQYISLALHEISLTTKNHLNRFKLLIKPIYLIYTQYTNNSKLAMFSNKQYYIQSSMYLKNYSQHINIRKRMHKTR